MPTAWVEATGVGRFAGAEFWVEATYVGKRPEGIGRETVGLVLRDAEP